MTKGTGFEGSPGKPAAACARVDHQTCRFRCQQLPPDRAVKFVKMRVYDGANQIDGMPTLEIAVGTKLRVANVPDTWFPAGSEVKVLDDCREGGVIVVGKRTCQKSEAEGGHAVGEIYEDEELCAWEEFEQP